MKKKITKGAPSAVLLSIVIHVGLFLLAGMLVVFTVVKKEEQKFEPPKVIERPKMKLKKPKVKVKKTSKPKPTTRIVTKLNNAAMPAIQLPEMSGIGGGLSTGISGGFDLMPELSNVSIFGGGQSIGNDFIGTFYDLKRSRSGSYLSSSKEEVVSRLASFVKNGWKSSSLSRYYQSPNKLYTTSFMIPPLISALGPRAFGEDTGGWNWAVVYRGKLVYPEDIKFRFWGFGDAFFVIRVDGELVLDGSAYINAGHAFISEISGYWDSSASNDRRFYYGISPARVGDWIKLKAGEALDMDVLLGELSGNNFSAMLTVEVEGVDYPKNGQGGPILPMFTTAEPSRDLQDLIFSALVPDEVAITNGPVFRDYTPVSRSKTHEPTPNLDKKIEAESLFRMWTLTSGKALKAEYKTLMAGTVVLKTAKGKQLKIPLDSLIPADREAIELLNPPKFSIDFIKLSNNKGSRYPQSPFLDGEQRPRVNDFTFGARVKQRSSGRYTQEITVEYFAVGKELLGEKFILLDYQSSTFTPTKKNERSHSFKGEVLEMIEYVGYGGQQRGVRPDGYIIIITDKRGRIIQHRASKNWLWENFESLRSIPVNAYIDKNCSRVFPTSPKRALW